MSKRNPAMSKRNYSGGQHSAGKRQAILTPNLKAESSGVQHSVGKKNRQPYMV